MDFRHLQYVLKVAEEGTFSKAAQKLYIAQPSLSQFIQKLEQNLGTQLFDRTTTPVKLTFAGELYIKTARHILDLNEQLSRQIEDVADLKKGRITLGISPVRGTYLLPDVLPLFQKKFPGIEVNLVENTSSELEKLTVRGITDITILTLPLQAAPLTYEPLLTEEILVALPCEHPIAQAASGIQNNLYRRPQIKLSQLQEDSFILLRPGQGLRQIADDLFLQAEFKPKILLETVSMDTAHALVAGGTGVAFIPETVVWFGKMSQHPVYFSLKNNPPARTLVVAYRKDRYLSKASKKFIQLLKEVLGLPLINKTAQKDGFEY